MYVTAVKTIYYGNSFRLMPDSGKSVCVCMSSNGMNFEHTTVIGHTPVYIWEIWEGLITSQYEYVVN